MHMKSNFTSFSFTTLLLLFICSSVNATDYNISSGDPIDITTPGSHTITGTGSSSIYINSSVNDAVFEITLDNMVLTAEDWASSITINNNSTGSMTVKFIIVGTNFTQGYNHGGIQAGSGTVNVIFTTTSSGTLTSTAVWSDSFAFKNNGGTMLPSIDPYATCTATLEGQDISIEDAFSLTGAFSKRPLVLSISKSTTSTNNIKSLDLKVIKTSSGINIEGLRIGEKFKIFDVKGKCVIQNEAKNETESVILSKGIYILQTEKGIIKF